MNIARVIANAFVVTEYFDEDTIRSKLAQDMGKELLRHSTITYEPMDDLASGVIRARAVVAVVVDGDQAVDAVLCKDCKCWDRLNQTCAKHFGHWERYDFCSRGERKEQCSPLNNGSKGETI